MNLNELQGHVNNWREIICDFAKEGFQVATQNSAISLAENSAVLNTLKGFTKSR